MSPKKLDGQKLIQFLNQKWGNAKCPLCGHGNWNVDTNIVTLINATDGVIQIGGNYLATSACYLHELWKYHSGQRCC